MDLERKLRHEEFTKLAGVTSTFEILCLTIFPGVLFSLRNNLIIALKPKKWNVLIHFIVDFSMIVLPLLLLLTVFSRFSTLCFLFLSAVTCVWSFYLFMYGKAQVDLATTWRSAIEVPQVSIVRGTVLCTVCVMIFNIDLPICPRRFAKTDDFGLSLMDVGTGYFICISALSGSSLMLRLPDRINYWHQMRVSVLPCLLVGALRTAAVGIIGYQSHVKEYGVHWNFFLTIAAIRVFSALAFVVIAHQRWWYPVTFQVKLMYLSVCCCICLAASHLANAAVNNPPDLLWPSMDDRKRSLILANIEGLVSLLGYMSLYFIALTYLTIVRHFNCQLLSKESRSISISYPVLYLLGTTIFALISLYLGLRHGFDGISRRFANLQYVFIMCFFFAFGNLSAWLSYVHMHSLRQAYHQHHLSLAFFNTISKHAMPYFLLSNLLTGCINLMVDTVTFIQPEAILDTVTGSYYPMSGTSVCTQFMLLLAYCLVGIGCIHVPQFRIAAVHI